MNFLKYGTPSEGSPGSVARRKSILEDLLREIVRRSHPGDSSRYVEVPPELIEEARIILQVTDA